MTRHHEFDDQPEVLAGLPMRCFGAMSNADISMEPS